MSLTSIALKAIEYFHPDYKPYLDFITNHEDKLKVVADVAAAAVKEGASALEAAEEAAPELAAAIRKLVAAQPGVAPTQAHADKAIELGSEQFTRQMFQLPRLSPEDEQAWMDSSTSWLNDSRAGSG